jgi:plastocyanin
MDYSRGYRWMLAGALATALIVVALGLGARSVAAQESAAVSIVDFAFQPASVEIATGGTVTWTNTGQAPHTVTADDGSFDSCTLSPGATFSQTFATAGTFTYHCNIHPQMTATVIVGGPGGSGSDAQAQAAPAQSTPQAADGGKQAKETKANKVPNTGVGTMAEPAQSGALALLAALVAAGLGVAALRTFRRA